MVSHITLVKRCSACWFGYSRVRTGQSLGNEWKYAEKKSVFLLCSCQTRETDGTWPDMRANNGGHVDSDRALNRRKEMVSLFP